MQEGAGGLSSTERGSNEGHVAMRSLRTSIRVLWPDLERRVTRAAGVTRADHPMLPWLDQKARSEGAHVEKALAVDNALTVQAD